ncbi:MAG: SDR family NAD(P)-dependent oxidoreductase [Gammaproteobacteria bacterium]|nr:SDR family NAD(P)-dependent oxidoreductase [Gammaproteobacteria bacterium]
MNRPVQPMVSGTSDPVALSPLKRAFLALDQAQARVAVLEQAAREPIAVIGLGCRVPGGGHDAESFWQLMKDGVDAISRVPTERWDIDAYFDPDPAVPGKIATSEGGFIGAVDHFDPGFFGIAPREAQGMDPQQRLMLEVAWEALENAGQAPDRLGSSNTGVYLGVCSADYTYLQLQSGDPSLLNAHFTSGIAHSIFSGRLSYLLGLQGPSITIDTACSSSLVAVHLAVQALRTRECHMALAGGVNLMLAPDIFIALSHSRMLAPDGRCKTFDAAADGFGRGEGCGVVVLKRLSEAQADGDRILAVIRGSAVNQDGPSSGLTAPHGPAQEAVIRAALANAGVAPRQIGYIEAHGTGTQLGDPLEVQALSAVFGADRQSVAPLVIGSVKTNIGHLEGAAGVTGLIKLILSLQHRTIPTHLHFLNPSPHIHWTDNLLQVAVETMPWMPIDGKRIGGVSSFGFSGTNVHLVVEEASPVLEASQPTPLSTYLFTLSARDERALSELAARHVQALQGRRDDELADICYTANHGRAHFEQRAALVVRSISELCGGLQALAQGKGAPQLRVARVTRRDPPKVAFLYTGQGSQYIGMARGLYETAPAFRASLDRCAAGLDPYLDRPLLDVLFPPEGQNAPLDETAYTQPALFAVEYALTQLWRAWGLTPNVVIGHSVGEVVAACVAGVMALEDALRLISKRGQLMQSLPSGGAMAAVGAEEHAVAEMLRPHVQHVSIAAVNGPAQTVISGAAPVVDTLCEAFTGQGVRCQRLPVSHAFHSPLVEPILDLFEREVASLRLSPPQLRLISNLTGRVAGVDELTQPAYWRRHIRETVRFGDGLRALESSRCELVLEIGPHPTLTAFVSAVFGADGPQRISSLHKNTPDWEHLLSALASVYLAGAAIDWRAQATTLDGGLPRIVDLPTYAFQRERCWFQARPKPLATSKGHGNGHALLGTRLRSAAAVMIYESHIGADSPPFVREHRVQAQAVLPATAYLEILLACGQALWQGKVTSIEDVVIQEAMLLAEDGALRAVQTVCEPASEGGYTLTISSQAADADDADPWVRHVNARVRAADDAPALNFDLDELRKRCDAPVATQDFYAEFERRGLDFGVGFRSIRQLWRGQGEALGEVELADGLNQPNSGYALHPVLLDGCLQVLAAAIPESDGDDALYLPIGIGRYVFHRRTGSRCWSHVTLLSGGEGAIQRAELRVFAANGALLAEMREIQLKRVTNDALERLGDRWLDGCLYETHWDFQPIEITKRPYDGSPQAFAQQADAGLDKLLMAVGLSAYDDFLVRFEALCVDYVVQALRRLGWAPSVGTRIEAGVLAEQLGVASIHRRLFGRLLAILGEAGILARDGQATDSWRVTQPLPDVDPQRQWTLLQASCPTGAEAELEMTGRVAAELAEALRGEREPMQLLFPGGSLDTAKSMYRDSPTARLFNGLMGEVMAAVATAHKQGRTLRILELGAGTGGTTAHVLPRLAGADIEYTFTDIGPLFIAKARESFGSYGFMRFEVLDLEREPSQQGFAGRQYDVVIASNVIHATADLRQTLWRVRGLMAPGALLAMIEVTAPQRWFDLTVGLTTGWWSFSDRDLRPDYPTLSRERWLALLPNCGFEECVALPAREERHGCLALQSALLGRATVATDREPGVWLLFVDQSGVGETLATRLRDRGKRCVLVRPGRYHWSGDSAGVDPWSPDDCRRLLGELRAAGVILAGVMHAWSLDAPVGEPISLDDLAQMQRTGVMNAMRLAQALVDQTPAPRLWMVTRGAQAVASADRRLSPSAATLWGLGKALRLEHPELQTVCIDLDPAAGGDDIDALVAELSETGHEAQVARRGVQRYVARLARRQRGDIVRLFGGTDSGEGAWRLAPEAPGSLDRLRRIPHPRRKPGPGEVEIAVEATALNFKDVLNVLGMYPGDPGPLGGECAGRVSAVGAGVMAVRVGDRVMALAGGSFASHVVVRTEFVQPLPVGVSPEEGASFSIAFLTAEFCLGHLAGLRAGQRVLIHAAAGGVGMAAVRLAQHAGAEIFATAGAPWKREVLRSMGVMHVFDSRSASFAEKIMTITDGRGVDVVLNSLAGDLIEPSFAVLARGGCFIEIGKRGIKSPEWVAALDQDLRYHIVDWGETAAQDPAFIGQLYARLAERLRDGSLVALPRHVFALDQTERAFRLMAEARHVGKIVVRHLPAPRWMPRRDGAYLVTGGLSGLGLQVAQWLATHGAGRLVLIGRRGVTPEAAPVIDAMRSSGVTVVAEAIDVADEDALRALLSRIRGEGSPLRGLWHCAGVLEDAGLLQQDETRYTRVFAPKVRGSHLLNKLTRGDPLECFVLFSSVAAVLGSAGQSNHSAANSFLDTLAQERASQGLSALSINWGNWTEVGAVADRNMAGRLAAQGLGAITTAQGLLAMQRLLDVGAAQAAVLPINWDHYLAQTSPAEIPAFLSDVAGAVRKAEPTAVTPTATSQETDLGSRLVEAPEARRRPLVLAFVRERALRALGVDPAKPIDPRTPLGELGLDSLLAVELRNTLGNALGRLLPATLLFDYPTIDALTDYLLNEVLNPGLVASGSSDTVELDTGLVSSIEELSDEEVDRLLMEQANQRKE